MHLAHCRHCLCGDLELEYMQMPNCACLWNVSSRCCIMQFQLHVEILELILKREKCGVFVRE